MLLSFPQMHPELWFGKKVDGLTFFDPGLTDEPVGNVFRPQDFPLPPKSARALIRDSINFGEQFKDPAEMAYFGAVTADDFYEGSSMSIQAQLTRQFDDGTGSKQEREDRDARSKAQFILLLAWTFEERLMELRGLEKGVRNGWDSMDKSLGMDEEDRLNERVVDLGNALSHKGGLGEAKDVMLPWQRIIESLPAFLPEETVLVCSDQAVLEAWQEYGIEFVEDEEGRLAATLPAWKFGCRRKAPTGLPMALRDVTVAIFK